MAKQLRTTPDGRFVRSMGRDQQGKERRFYLGRHEQEAVIRNAMLEKLWNYWKPISAEVDGAPQWDTVTLTIAQAVAEGRREVTVDLDTHPTLAVGIMADLQDILPSVGIRLKDEQAQRQGETFYRTEGERLINEGRQLLKREGNQRLHEALTAYVQFVEMEYKIGTSELVSDWGQCKIRQIDYCRAQFPDQRLCDLDTPQIEALIRQIEKRPLRSNGKPISKVFAHSVIKEFRQFLRWLHRSREWQWTRPDDYEQLPVKIKMTPEEKAMLGPIRVDTYNLDELKTLWRYATPWERALMTFGLNCGFGMAEIGTLRKDELFLNQPHPHADVLQITSDEKDSWIRRVRHKTIVYGEWRLWSITVQAAHWLLAHRPQSENPCLVLTKNGTPLKVEGVRNNQIANAWVRLLTRVQKDKPAFTKLSFNKLRKTAANMVTVEAGLEIGTLFTSHGSPVGDTMMVHYTNPRYHTLHSVIYVLGEKLRDVFTSVDDPFPQKETRGNYISLGKIEAIERLHLAGMRTGLIAEKLELSRETVRRHIKNMQARQSDRIIIETKK